MAPITNLLVILRPVSDAYCAAAYFDSALKIVSPINEHLCFLLHKFQIVSLVFTIYLGFLKVVQISLFCLQRPFLSNAIMSLFIVIHF